MTIEPQPAGPTFARSARVNGTCTTYGRIYIYKKHIYIYIYIYDEDFSPLYDKCGARAARQLFLKFNMHRMCKNENNEEKSRIAANVL